MPVKVWRAVGCQSPRLAPQPLGLRLAGGGQFGLAAFLVAQPHDGVAQCGQRRRGIGPLRRQAQQRATARAQAQQRGQVLGIGHRIAAAHVHPRGEALDRLRPLPGRARVQPVGVVERQLVAQRKVLQTGGLGRARGLLARERPHDLAGIARGRQAVHQGVVAHQAGQAAQHRDVFVRRGGNGHHQARLLGIVAPAHAARHLQHGQAGAQHEVLVFHHAVRNGQALAQEGVGDFLALQQAVGVGRLGMAGLGQQGASGAHGVFSVVGRGAQADLDRDRGHGAMSPCFGIDFSEGL